MIRRFLTPISRTVKKNLAEIKKPPMLIIFLFSDKNQFDINGNEGALVRIIFNSGSGSVKKCKFFLAVGK